jgi:hypothetical protein
MLRAIEEDSPILLMRPSLSVIPTRWHHVTRHASALSGWRYYRGWSSYDAAKFVIGAGEMLW